MKGAITMPAGSSAERERQCERIRKSAKQRGASEDRAEGIAARTVNEGRAQAGQSRTASRTSTQS